MNTISNIEQAIKTLDISSTAFIHRNYIPKKYTCEGENINPPLVIEHIPEKTKSLVLILEDPDALIRPWTHWLAWNIPPMKKIQENSSPGIEGLTDFGSRKYNGPCPSSGLHYFHFKVYALDALLNLNPGATRHEVEKHMSSHILAYSELVGLYKRANSFEKMLLSKTT